MIKPITIHASYSYAPASASYKPTAKGVANKYSIKRIAENRGIPFLVHFTSAKNLATILRYGLLSRESLDQMGIPYLYNDNHRFDGHLNAISLSIAHPNEKMFYQCRDQALYHEWVVLVIDPSVLWEKIVTFYKLNAAKGCYRSMSLGYLQTAKAFEYMFSTYGDEHRFGLSDFDPTDVQAEVLSFDSIELDLIHSFDFADQRTANKYRPLLEQYGKAYSVDEHQFYERRAFARTPKYLFSLQR